MTWEMWMWDMEAMAVAVGFFMWEQVVRLWRNEP